jgi:hypothetical protein
LQFPDGPEMLDLLAARGLTELVQHRLTGGIASLYVGKKPLERVPRVAEGGTPSHFARDGESLGEPGA